MDDNTIKAEISSVVKKIALSKRQLTSNQAEQREIKEKIISAENGYQEHMRDAKRNAFEKFLTECTKQLDNEVVQISEQINEANQRYKNKKMEYDNADISDFYTDEAEISADIKTSVEVLQKHLDKTLSKRFTGELDSQLQSGNIDLQNDNMLTLVDYFNSQSKYIAKLNRDSVIDNIIGAVNGFCVQNPFTISEDKKQANIQVGGIILVIAILMLITAKVVFPFYLIFLILFAVYNIIQNYKIYAALIAHKIVKDNISQIDAQLREQAEQRLKEKKERLEKAHLQEIAELDNKLYSAKQQLNEARKKAESDFKFDDEEVRHLHDSSISVSSNKLESLIADEKDIQKNIDILHCELNKLQSDLSSMAGDIQNAYLDYNKVGTDAVLKPDFIFDIVDNKPVFFEHPQTSCLFIYEDRSDVINFIKLINVQLRIKLNPFNLNVSVIDINHMGSNYISMQPQVSGEDTSMRKLFQIISETEELNDFYVGCREEIRRRSGTVLKSHDCIKKYNEAMLASDSLTESYEFIFYQDPDTNFLSHEAFVQVLHTGANVGIFMHVFIEKKVFYELGHAARDFIDKVETVFVLTNSACDKRAKTFVKENLIKPEN